MVASQREGTTWSICMSGCVSNFLPVRVSVCVCPPRLHTHVETLMSHDSPPHHSGSGPGRGSPDADCSQGAVCGHEHPLHANRPRLPPAQRRDGRGEQLQPAVTLLPPHLVGPPHRPPADGSQHFPGQQVSVASPWLHVTAASLAFSILTSSGVTPCRISPAEWSEPGAEGQNFTLLHSFWYITGALTLQGKAEVQVTCSVCAYGWTYGRQSSPSRSAQGRLPLALSSLEVDLYSDPCSHQH